MPQDAFIERFKDDPDITYLGDHIEEAFCPDDIPHDEFYQYFNTVNLDYYKKMSPADKVQSALEWEYEGFWPGYSLADQMLMRAAEIEFGLEPYFDNPELNSRVKPFEKHLRKIARYLYDYTQELLERLDVDKMRLWRGFALPRQEAERMMQEIGKDGTIEVCPDWMKTSMYNPDWVKEKYELGDIPKRLITNRKMEVSLPSVMATTLNQVTAEEIAGYSHPPDTKRRGYPYNFVAEIDVRREDVLSIPLTGKACGGGYEEVSVMWKPRKVRVYAVEAYPDAFDSLRKAS